MKRNRTQRWRLQTLPSSLHKTLYSACRRDTILPSGVFSPDVKRRLSSQTGKQAFPRIGGGDAAKRLMYEKSSS